MTKTRIGSIKKEKIAWNHCYIKLECVEDIQGPDNSGTKYEAGAFGWKARDEWRARDDLAILSTSVGYQTIRGTDEI